MATVVYHVFYWDYDSVVWGDVWDGPVWQYDETHVGLSFTRYEVKDITSHGSFNFDRGVTETPDLGCMSLHYKKSHV